MIATPQRLHVNCTPMEATTILNFCTSSGGLGMGGLALAGALEGIGKGSGRSEAGFTVTTGSSDRLNSLSF